MQAIQPVMNCCKLVLIILNHEQTGDRRGEHTDDAYARQH